MPDDTLEQFLQAAVAMLSPDQPIEARVVAVGVLGSLGDERHAPPLLQTLGSDEHRQVRYKAAQSLARVGSDDALEQLQALVYSEDAYTRFLAAEAIADIIARGPAEAEESQ